MTRAATDTAELLLGEVHDGVSARRHSVRLEWSAEGITLVGDGIMDHLGWETLTWIDLLPEAILLGRADQSGWRLRLDRGAPGDLIAKLPGRPRFGSWIDRFGFGKSTACFAAVSSAVAVLLVNTPNWLGRRVPIAWETGMTDDGIEDLSAYTQAFNTTTSMGRLTLNVLLSFAQFEREVTGERIRDKIAASKKKGIWMGGPVSLGYQVIDRKLIPVPEEAERVRTIMQRYLEVRNVPRLIEILQAEGVVTKVQHRTSGPHRGGIPFARGSLFHLLKNPVYRGKIVHKGKVYDGEHEAIVDEALWNQVQSHLAAKAPPRKRSTNKPQQAMLRGLITDPHGRPMVPTYGSSKVKRYAYYETRKDLARPGDPPGIRFQRGHLEQHLIGYLEELLGDEHGQVTFEVSVPPLALVLTQLPPD